MWYCSFLCYICCATLQTFFSSSRRKHFPIILHTPIIQSCEIQAISCEIVGHWDVLKGWRGPNQKKKKNLKKGISARQSLISLHWCNLSPVWALALKSSGFHAWILLDVACVSPCLHGSSWTYPVSPLITQHCRTKQQMQPFLFTTLGVVPQLLLALILAKQLEFCHRMCSYSLVLGQLDVYKYSNSAHN